MTFPSRSPFVLADVTTAPDGSSTGEPPPTTAVGTLFRPHREATDPPVPAVVLLHGSGGVLGARELTYGRQFAAMGVAALVVDAFAARRDLATGFTERLVRITETMMMADAYAALDFLAADAAIDSRRVTLIGFSYGALAALAAANGQVAERLASPGRRFAGHVAFYPPCLAEFEEPRTTGAPVLMLLGGRDGVSDPERCAAVADELRRGGSTVQLTVYPDAVHQWDGGFSGPRPVGRTPAACRLRVERDGTIRDRHTGLPMTGPLLRQLILSACIATGEPYLIGRDDAVRARSNRDLADFLDRVFRS